jgi:hypothetical protein
MITNIILALLLLTVAAIAFYRHRRSLGEFFANVVTITSVNTFQEGRKTYLADNPFTSRYLLCKIGSDASHIDICTSSDVPLGVVPDMTPTTDVGGNLTYPLPVNLFPVTNTTERLIAAGPVAVGQFVSPAPAGQVQLTPASTGTYYVVGRALTTALAAGDMIEVSPMFFKDRVP